MKHTYKHPARARRILALIAALICLITAAVIPISAALSVVDPDTPILSISWDDLINPGYGADYWFSISDSVVLNIPSFGSSPGNSVSFELANGIFSYCITFKDGSTKLGYSSPCSLTASIRYASDSVDSRYVSFSCFLDSYDFNFTKGFSFSTFGTGGTFTYFERDSDGNLTLFEEDAVQSVIFYGFDKNEATVDFWSLYRLGFSLSLDDEVYDGYGYGYDDGYDNGYQAGYDQGYSSGESNGYQTGYTEGQESVLGIVDGEKQEAYDIGYGNGRQDGYLDGLNDGSMQGYDRGYGEGKFAGESEAHTTLNSFKEMVFAIFDAPGVLIDGILDFEIFGINVAGLVKTVITLALVAAVVFLIIKLKS